MFPLLAALLLGPTAGRADQIVLKNGQEYSGKFVRGDAGVVEFRILGRIESFKTAEVDRIVFKEPELQPAPSRAPVTEPAPAANAQPAAQPVPPVSVPRSEPARETKSWAAPGMSVTYPVGTSLTVRTTSEIDTDRNRVGDTFTATLEEPLLMGSQMVVPRGAEVKGRITESKESGRIAGKSELALELTEITAGGKSYTVRTGEYSEVGSSRGNRTAKTAGGGAALGAIIGAIAGGGKGAAIGAATGAAAGTGVQLLTKGETLKVPVETALEFRLQAPVTIAVP
jgi:hypothetical protein